ncbi:MAG: ATP-binding protein, partial [Candidatus Cloacimonetes bacterium]|nr:ATP-binding protein [Candidatus Cloacimonadota bacterium]
ILVLPLLEKDDLEAGQKEEYLQIIRDEIEKVRVFTHSFQRFTELKNYDLKLQDIAPSLEHVISHLRLPENITLIKNWTLKSVHAFIEPIRFEEALINLINNAVEAMPDGGTLHVSIKSFPNHSSPKGPLSVLVEIEDNGIGIPEKYLDEIFNPFFTTNQSGTGIGIPESRKIIESMGGEIHIQSEEGVGTVVSLWLKGESDGKD